MIPISEVIREVVGPLFDHQEVVSFPKLHDVDSIAVIKVPSCEVSVDPKHRDPCLDLAYPTGTLLPDLAPIKHRRVRVPMALWP